MHYSFGRQECNQLLLNADKVNKGTRNNRITSAVQQLFRVFKNVCRSYKGPVYQLKNQLKKQFQAEWAQLSEDRIQEDQKQSQLDSNCRSFRRFDGFINNRKVEQNQKNSLLKPLIRRDPFRPRVITEGPKQLNSLPTSVKSAQRAVNTYQYIRKQAGVRKRQNWNLESKNTSTIPQAYLQNIRKVKKLSQQKQKQFRKPKTHERKGAELARPRSRSGPAGQRSKMRTEANQISLHEKNKKNISKMKELVSIQQKSVRQNTNRNLKMIKEEVSKKLTDQTANKRQSQTKKEIKNQKKKW